MTVNYDESDDLMNTIDDRTHLDDEQGCVDVEEYNDCDAADGEPHGSYDLQDDADALPVVIHPLSR